MSIKDTLRSFVGTNPNALSQDEADRLAKLEQAFTQVKDSWRQGARILSEIRDRRLYRSTDRTFADYVLRRWEMDVSTAYKLIRADAVADSVAETATLTFEQAKALAQVPPENRQQVIDQAGGEAATISELEEAGIPFKKGRRVKRKKPKDAHFRGQGWHIIVKRSRPVDLDQIAVHWLKQMQEKEAA